MALIFISGGEMPRLLSHSHNFQFNLFGHNIILSADDIRTALDNGDIFQEDLELLTLAPIAGGQTILSIDSALSRTSSGELPLGSVSPGPGEYYTAPTGTPRALPALSEEDDHLQSPAQIQDTHGDIY